ncbi:right-handed parallel beta-helix repeat-containing protein [Cellulomonas sp. URHB0016]
MSIPSAQNLAGDDALGEAMRLPVLVPCLAVLVGPWATVPTPTVVAEPTCGTTVTVDSTLRHDLECTGDGLTLGPGVTLDLGGHTVTGSGRGTGVSVASAGTVSVVNGTLAGWGTGISTFVSDEDQLAGPLTVERVTVRNSRWGLDASGQSGTGAYAKPTTVARSTFADNDAGVVAGWFGSPTITRTTFTDNRVGLWVSSATAHVGRSDLLRNGVGIRVYESSVVVDDRTTFMDNDRGLTVGGVGSTTVDDSRFRGGDVAATVLSGRLSMTGNVLTGSGTGVLVAGGAGTFDDNTFRGNGVGFHHVQSSEGPTTLRGNVFRLNGDGIVVENGDPSVRLGQNTARRNTGWGIDAPGVTDLGGNTARRNGNEPQCVGVVCP